MQRSIFTIGHGRLEIDRFLQVLQDSNINCVVDVRSHPASRWSPDYNQKQLESRLSKSGIKYIFSGVELGGRPPEKELYDSSGHVLYKPMSMTIRFEEGIRDLLKREAVYNVAVLCSESLPEKCHRNLLIGRVLTQKGYTVIHLLHDGSSEPFDISLLTSQTFEIFDEEDQWRSLVQIRVTE